MGRASPGRGNSVRASYLSVLEVMKLRMRRGVRNARFCIDMPDIFATVEEVHISTYSCITVSGNYVKLVMVC